MIVNGLNISIKLDNKIYVTKYNSSVGKTFLLNMLKSYDARPENEGKLLLITYDKKQSIENILSMIREFKGIFILLDRFDLYYDISIVQALTEKNIPVLLDLKNYKRFNEFSAGLAKLTIFKDKIEVIGL